MDRTEQRALELIAEGQASRELRDEIADLMDKYDEQYGFPGWNELGDLIDLDLLLDKDAEPEVDILSAYLDGIMYYDVVWSDPNTRDGAAVLQLRDWLKSKVG